MNPHYPFHVILPKNLTYLYVLPDIDYAYFITNMGHEIKYLKVDFGEKLIWIGWQLPN